MSSATFPGFEVLSFGHWHRFSLFNDQAVTTGSMPGELGQP